MFNKYNFQSTVRISASAIALGLLSIGLSSCGSPEEATTPQAVAVRLRTLESAILTDSSEYVASLEARDRVSLAPRIDGRILEIFVSQGDWVERSEPIVRLEPTQEQEDVNAATQNVNVERARLGQIEAELRTAQANRSAAAAEVESARADLEDAEAEVELAQINIERTRSLVEGGALAQQNLDDDNSELRSSLARRNSRNETLNAAIESLQAAERQIEQARANINSQNAVIGRAESELGSVSQNLAFNTINAPIDGIVGSFDENKIGDYVSVGEQLTTITNNQSFDLNISIPIENRDRLEVGLPVEIINTDGNAGVEGEITYVAPLVQQNTQSVLAKATFTNANSLRDREYARVRVIWNERPGVLVPTVAVSSLSGQNFVYVATEDNSQEDADSSLIVQQRPVNLGNIENQSYQVISGLEPGERIAVSNVLSLNDGAEIEPTEEGETAVSSGKKEAEE